MVDVRGYQIGHHNIAQANEDTWIVETRESEDVAKEAILDDAVLSARPSASQIVGTVRFSKSLPYGDEVMFRSDRARQRIQA